MSDTTPVSAAAHKVETQLDLLTQSPGLRAGARMKSVNTRAKKLREEVLELPRATRAELAHDLLLSLEEGELEAPEAVEKAWAEEIDRRLLDVKEGRVKLIPAEEAFRQVRANLKRVHGPLVPCP